MMRLEPVVLVKERDVLPVGEIHAAGVYAMAIISVSAGVEGQRDYLNFVCGPARQHALDPFGTTRPVHDYQVFNAAMGLRLYTFDRPAELGIARRRRDDGNEIPALVFRPALQGGAAGVLRLIEAQPSLDGAVEMIDGGLRFARLQE